MFVVFSKINRYVQNIKLSFKYFIWSINWLNDSYNITNTSFVLKINFECDELNKVTVLIFILQF